MKIEGSLAYKKLNQCSPGELVRFRAPYDLAIIADQQSGHTRFGFLKPRCILSRYPSDTDCISYGVDWLLVPEPGDETYPKNNNHTEDSGALHVDARGMLMTFSPSSEGMALPLALRLPSMEVVETPGHHSAPILRWKLWLSEAARDRGEEPFFEFQPPAPEPAEA
jgi:hypothetical protein